MRSLHARLDASTGNVELTDAVMGWWDDRLVQDDVLAALREVLPGVDEESLLAAVAAVSRVIKEP